MLQVVFLSAVVLGIFGGLAVGAHYIDKNGVREFDERARCTARGGAIVRVESSDTSIIDVRYTCVRTMT